MPTPDEWDKIADDESEWSEPLEVVGYGIAVCPECSVRSIPLVVNPDMKYETAAKFWYADHYMTTHAPLFTLTILKGQRPTALT